MAFVVTGFLLLGACSDIPSSTTPVAEGTHPHASVQWAGNPELAKVLATVRASTAAFHDPAVALAAGYRATLACESSSTGAMGFHYSNPALLGVIPRSRPLNGTDAVIDPARPEVLLYEPQADGTVRLVAVEYVVFRSAWDALYSEPPTLAGIPFDERFGSNAHGISDHYELHAWVWRNNPLGMFSPYNPKVSCQP
ncbi:MAG: hypothetical protein M3R07_05870 [Gemmatimonadota bacterium]|nr:hypothetical protein [Gemmatimonadota bacterium]